jgi:hypothetical protein
LTNLTDHQLLEHAVTRIVVRPNTIEVTCKSSGKCAKPTIKIPWSKPKKRGFAKVDEALAQDTNERRPNGALVQAVVRAHVWMDLLKKRKYDSVEALAKAVQLHPKVIRKSLRLAFLEPRIVRDVLEGKNNSALRDMSRPGEFQWKIAKDRRRGLINA